MREIIYDREAEPWHVALCDDLSPRFHHCEIEHGPVLSSSENWIVDNLIAQGYPIHETVTTYHLAFPPWLRERGSSFVGSVWHEFQAELGTVGFLRWRFDVPGEGYLVLFHVRPDHQNCGHARKWFPKVTNDLLKAGAKSLRGQVRQSVYPGKSMNVRRLSEFYRREAGFEILEDDWIRKTSPYEKQGTRKPHGVSYAAPVLQS